MKADLSFEDALAGHELDVAGFEIWDKRAQLDNLKKWLSGVKESDQPKVEAALKRLGIKTGRA